MNRNHALLYVGLGLLAVNHLYATEPKALSTEFLKTFMINDPEKTKDGKTIVVVKPASKAIGSIVYTSKLNEEESYQSIELPPYWTNSLVFNAKDTVLAEIPNERGTKMEYVIGIVLGKNEPKTIGKKTSVFSDYYLIQLKKDPTKRGTTRLVEAHRLHRLDISKIK